MQRYQCLNCKKYFTGKRRQSRLRKVLWHQYIWHRQTVEQLAVKYQRSEKWIRHQLDKAPLSKFRLHPQPVVGVADITFWGRGYGVLVFRCQDLKKNLYWTEVATETAAVYMEARQALEKLGYTFETMILDGRKGIREVFADIPVQICHFHQLAAIKRYLTGRPKLEAGIELRAVALALSKLNEQLLSQALNEWHAKWQKFLKERTYAEDRKHWQHTHRRIRAAYRSLKTNLPYLYTYQKYPKLRIANTTNSLDGSFSHLKDLLSMHRGLKRPRRWRIIQEVLAK